MARALRFSGRRAVEDLLGRGRSFRTELGRTVWGPPARPGDASALFVVSKRVSKRSTARNRIRRQLHEAFRACWQERPFSIAAVIYVSPTTALLPGRARRALARELCRRLAALARR